MEMREKLEMRNSFHTLQGIEFTDYSQVTTIFIDNSKRFGL